MKEIVEKTGMSKGAFYHYFSSKQHLFREIIDYFFSAILAYDFGELPDDSLQHFYRAYAEQINSLRFRFLSGEDGKGEDFIDLNFFSLLFNAFKLFPEFRYKMEDYHQKEIHAWTAVIRKARKTGEISTPLTDQQIAQLFMFSSDGLTMNLTMERDTTDIDKRLASLWDNFYSTLKT